MKASVNAFVPYEKLSKKQKREIDRARRADWGTVNPVSRRVESAKVYNRKKRRSGREDCGTGAFYLLEKWKIGASVRHAFA